MQRLSIWAAAAWLCSLLTIGLLVVPLLFATLPTPALAGTMAARLFSAQTWVSLACGLVLILCLKGKVPAMPNAQAQTAMLFIALGMALALFSEFAVAPRIVARENLRLWHSLGSALYLVQCICAGMGLWIFTPARES